MFSNDNAIVELVFRVFKFSIAFPVNFGNIIFLGLGG